MLQWGQNAWLASAGAWVGFIAWGTSTQLNYSLVPWECESGMHLTPWVAFALVGVAIAGGLVSHRSFRHRGQRLETATPIAGTPFEMLAVVGVAASALFALIILLHCSAALLAIRCAP